MAEKTGLTANGRGSGRGSECGCEWSSGTRSQEAKKGNPKKRTFLTLSLSLCPPAAAAAAVASLILTEAAWRKEFALNSTLTLLHFPFPDACSRAVTRICNPNAGERTAAAPGHAFVSDLMR